MNLDERALELIRKYAQVRDEMNRAATDKEILQLREEARSYAAEFAFTVLMLNPELATEPAEVTA